MKKFLIVQLASFGDCLYATAIARQIKNDTPNSHVTWAIAKRFVSVLHLNPYVDAIWEIEIPSGTPYYNNNFDNQLRATIASKKAAGEFDEIIYSQIPPKNWGRFLGTIRASTLAAYPGKITVPVQPILVLSEEEKTNVQHFAEKHQLAKYKTVILFECAPSSGQSLVNTAFALDISKKLVEEREDCCFILSTPSPIQSGHPRIIDGSVISFRENAGLSHYCHFLIGCSSGITWVCSATAAKQLNTLQLLNSKSGIYAGLNFELASWHLPNDHVVEMTDYDETKVLACLRTYFTEGQTACKTQYNQIYRPDLTHLYTVAGFMYDGGSSLKDVFAFARSYCVYNATLNNPIHLNRWHLSWHLIIKQIKLRLRR